MATKEHATSVVEGAQRNSDWQGKKKKLGKLKKDRRGGERHFTPSEGRRTSRPSGGYIKNQKGVGVAGRNALFGAKHGGETATTDFFWKKSFQDTLGEGPDGKGGGQEKSGDQRGKTNELGCVALTSPVRAVWKKKERGRVKEDSVPKKKDQDETKGKN